jgi:hypothetical protein
MKRSRKVNTNDDASKVDIRIKKDNKTYMYVYKLGDDKKKGRCIYKKKSSF